jgi:uncharacterized protein YxeA
MSVQINKQKVKRGALITIGSILVLVIAGLLIYTNFTYSKGYRNGTVVKISEKGVMFKTWEGQLNIGAYTNAGEGAPTTIWEFSVPGSNEKVLEDINASIDNGKRVKLHYKEKLVTLPWRGDTKYLIYKVDILE